MPQQLNPAVENHFIAGLKTEFTGLNFPENAATDTKNCVFSLIGDVTRRGGINYEPNFVLKNIDSTSVAKSSYRWKNVGGDGLTQMLVQQIGSTLYFFLSSNATPAVPLSTTLLPSTVNISSFKIPGNINNVALTECQITDGNGLLIVVHKDCDPFYCSYNSANQTITANVITLKIRDFVGIPEPSVANNFRPPTLGNEHLYNLQNQGWSSGTPWTALIYNNGLTEYPGPTNLFKFPTGSFNLTTNSTITIPIISQTNTTSIVNGSIIQLTFDNPIVTGSGSGNAGGVSVMTIFVTSYITPFTSLTGTILSATINVGSGSDTSITPYVFDYSDFYGYVKFNNFIKHSDSDVITATLTNVGFVQNWFTQVGNYPSNSDVWWLYKNTSDIFDPQHQLASVQQAFGPASKGYFIMNAFNQQRSLLSGILSLTDISTTTRPSTVSWYQGRVFYAGVNSSQQATGDEPYTTWTENVYFSQTVVDPSTDLGICYQTNDPTSQNLFSILPTDGGVITIQGCGSIYKLFPLRFGLLVFASNGIWFIGGSTGIGFAANDYTVTKISSIESISGISFIDVMGFPLFWNSEGIYQVVPSSQPGSAHSPDIQLDVQNLTLGSILTFYSNIPLISKAYSRGDYDQINYVVQWCYKNTSETGIIDRYSYDSILSFNTVTKAFYVYSLPSNPIVNDIKWVQNPGAIGEVLPIFKYTTVDGLGNMTFSEENDFTRYLDFFSFDNKGQNYTSFFITGYRLAGQALRKFEIPYIYFFSRNPGLSQYLVQSIWDYAGTGNSGRWSTVQRVTNSTTEFSMLYRRLRIRGRGLAVQLKITSVQGQPFDLMGWSIWNYANTGIS